LFKEERLGKPEAWACSVDQRDSEESRMRKVGVERKELNSGAGGACYQCNPDF